MNDDNSVNLASFKKLLRYLKCEMCDVKCCFGQCVVISINLSQGQN